MEEKKAYELRALGAKDVFTMARIINKVGIKNLKKCFASEELKNLIGGISEEEKEKDKNVTAVGMAVAFDVADVLLEHLPECEKELYAFLSDLSGIKVTQLQTVAPATFLEMIIDVTQKPEFKDFFEVASRLFK